MCVIAIISHERVQDVSMMATSHITGKHVTWEGHLLWLVRLTNHVWHQPFNPCQSLHDLCSHQPPGHYILYRAHAAAAPTKNMLDPASISPTPQNLKKSIRNSHQNYQNYLTNTNCSKIAQGEVVKMHSYLRSEESNDYSRTWQESEGHQQAPPKIFF